jgi:hypothetical protein
MLKLNVHYDDHPSIPQSDFWFVVMQLYFSLVKNGNYKLVKTPTFMELLDPEDISYHAIEVEATKEQVIQQFTKDGFFIKGNPLDSWYITFDDETEKHFINNENCL